MGFAELLGHHSQLVRAVGEQLLRLRVERLEWGPRRRARARGIHPRQYRSSLRASRPGDRPQMQGRQQHGDEEPGER